MTRRSATFQEVAISHCSSSHLLQETCYSVPKGINLIEEEDQNKSNSTSFSRSRSFLSCVWSLPRMALKLHSDNKSVTSSAVTINDYDSDSGETVSAPMDKERESISSKGPLKHLRKVIKSASFLAKSPKSERRSSLPSSVEPFPTEIHKVVRIENRVEGWTNVLKAAIQMDLRGDSKEALIAYCRFNRQVTKEAIYDFEMLTCDQQKLLNRLMLVLDQRIITLKTALWKPTSLSPVASSPTGRMCPAHDATLQDLYGCLSLLDTVKVIASSRKMPVVLVYRERHHRTQHRHQEKGKSNKIIFAKEKRDFLQYLGLPGSMVTEQGIDFDVRPSSSLSDGSPALLQKLKEGQDKGSEENSESLEVKSNHENADKTNGDVVETPFEGGAAALSEGDSRSATVSPQLKPPSGRQEKRISIVDQFLGIRKRFSVSPQRDDHDNSANHYRSCEVLSMEGPSSSKCAVDTRSTLSCDSCSSNESSISDFEEREDSSDTAVLANYSHTEALLSPPLQADGETYITLVLDKVGLKKTEPLESPFLRLSIRDCDGNLLAKEQETLTWQIINDNYLKAPSSIFIHEPLEKMAEDAAIFLEIRHILQEKRKISTLCYTFLEKSDIKSGDFVCELYKPPIQFARKNLIPYSEKAFFLHFEIQLENSLSESCSSATIQN